MQGALDSISRIRIRIAIRILGSMGRLSIARPIVPVGSRLRSESGVQVIQGVDNLGKESG